MIRTGRCCESICHVFLIYSIFMPRAKTHISSFLCSAPRGVLPGLPTLFSMGDPSLYLGILIALLTAALSLCREQRS